MKNYVKGIKFMVWKTLKENNLYDENIFKYLIFNTLYKQNVKKEGY